jgi:hypothetical protein
MTDAPRGFEYQGLTTLPLYQLKGRAQEDIPQFGSGEVRVEIVDPEYAEHEYSASPDWLQQIGQDAAEAIKMVTAWPIHLASLLYFVQLKDDADHRRIKALHDHTQLITSVSDARIHVETSSLGHTFDQIHGFQRVHSEYRRDSRRVEKYVDYASQLDAAWKRLLERRMEAVRAAQRIANQIEFKASGWARMTPILLPPAQNVPLGQLRLFCSYSHKDETLRSELEAHLAGLKRDGTIAVWHDREIVAGDDWRERIDENLKTAHVILLLISADFLASNFCWNLEVKRAMERHEAGTARVIPVILRDCYWSNAAFEKLQALPRDAKAVTSWTNRDEALADVARGIQRAIEQLRGGATFIY